MNEATTAQLRLIVEIRAALDAAGIAWWLYGGWAMDFHLGEVTRDHSDIEAFVWLSDAAAAKDALARAGFAAPPGIHPDEAQPFLKNGQEVGVWYLVSGEDGFVHTPGRWQDWPWPHGSFDEARMRIGDVEVPVMSVEGLLYMKVGFAQHPHGAPLREKDRADIARLQAFIASRSVDDW
jgi:hypothetical protein